MTQKNENFEHIPNYVSWLNAHNEQVHEPTYTQHWRLVDHLDFDLKNWLNDFDINNVPDEAIYKSALTNYFRDHPDHPIHQGRDIDIRTMGGPLADYLVDRMINVYGWDYYDCSIFFHPIGAVSKPHIDFHGKFRQVNGLTDRLQGDDIYKHVKRYWIPVQDKLFGHMFDIDGVPIPNWNSGDVFHVDTYVTHVGATLGYIPRVFITLTGMKETDEV